MRLRLSTWLCLALPAITSLVIAVPQLFLPRSLSSNTPAGDYGLTPREVLRGILLVLLVAELAVVLLYAAIRAALRPDFRRDALALAAGAALCLVAWIAVLFLGAR